MRLYIFIRDTFYGGLKVSNTCIANTKGLFINRKPYYSKKSKLLRRNKFSNNKLEFSEFTTKNGGFTIKTDIDFLERLCLSIDQFREIASYYIKKQKGIEKIFLEVCDAMMRKAKDCKLDVLGTVSEYKDVAFMFSFFDSFRFP